MPYCFAVIDACFVGLIKEAIPDFRAFAPSAAEIPPSLRATIIKAKSFTSPPSALTTGPAFGIAVVKSCKEREVWFSTALRKFTELARSSVLILKAFCKDKVVFIAS